MQKGLLLVHKDDFEKVIETVQEFGNFEAVNIDDEKMADYNFSASDEGSSDAEVRLAELDYLIRSISPFDTRQKSFRQKFLGAQIEGNEEDIQKVVESFDYKPLLKKVENIEEEINEKKLALVKVHEVQMTLSVWQDLKFSPTINKESEHAKMRLGEILTKDFTDFAIHLARIELAHFETIHETSSKTYFLVVFHKENATEVEGLLDSFRFNEIDFSFCDNTTPKEELTRLKEEENILKDRISVLEKELIETVEHLDQLKLTYDFHLWEKDKHKTRLKAYKSDSVVLLEGYTPKNKVADLEYTLEKISPNTEFIRVEEENIEKIPVEITNNSTAESFESVTRIFGLPLANEIDPTPYLAPFFAIFFGFCLTDAGYGILLALFSFIALKTLPLNKSMKGMLKLMLMCGFTTIFMGILFGGWFGMTVDQAPAFLVKDGKFIGQIFDPILDLVGKIMPLAFGLGFLHLLFGVILAGVVKIKNKKMFEAITSSFMLAVLLLLSIGMLIASMMKADTATISLLKWLSLISLVIVIWGMGAGKNPITRVLIGVINLVNEGISWLSNVLSYSRLFALGLATGIIASVFNSVALTIGGMLPTFIGIFVIIIIILAGHTLNIALNLLGAYIHSGRLQFVEFFGKFVEFGGRRFDPLKRKHKYLFTEKI